MAELSASLAVVTGSTSGIGKAIVLAFAKNGYSVLINGRSQATVDQVVREVQQHGADAKVFGVAGDIGTEDGATKFITDVDNICSSQGLHVGVLVNNAGIFEAANFFEVPDSTWQRQVYSASTHSFQFHANQHRKLNAPGVRQQVMETGGPVFRHRFRPCLAVMLSQSCQWYRQTLSMFWTAPSGPS